MSDTVPPTPRTNFDKYVPYALGLLQTILIVVVALLAGKSATVTIQPLPQAVYVPVTPDELDALKVHTCPCECCKKP